MADLHDEGVELLVHDAAVTKDTPLGALKSYVQHGSKGLGQLAGSLKEMMCEDVEDLMAEVDAVIVCHSNETYRQAVMAGPDIPVIDVVRLFRDEPAQVQVNGIGW